MSNEERDLIIGRAIRQESELEEELGALTHQLNEIVEALAEYTTRLQERLGRYLHGSERRQPLGTPAVISKYADISKITELANSRIEIEKKLDRINETLIQMK